MAQAQEILNHLQAGKRIDPMQALNEFGCNRLAARVLDLKRQGHNIKSELVTKRNGKRHAVYWL